MTRLTCWLLRGHRWGSWDTRAWHNPAGELYRLRWCERCGARDAQPARASMAAS